jgi:uncharacterized membrane protein YraQ (UPF0718 family)
LVETDLVTELIDNTLSLALEAAPWLLLGLILAGLIRAVIPETLMQRWLGGSGLWPVTKAAFVGAPIPLCSCGVVPAALSLRNSGASKGSTLSFMIATPETGVDSVAITYALMGPFMAITRPIASVITAIGVGTATGIAERAAAPVAAGTPASQGSPAACCSDEGCGSVPDIPTPLSRRIGDGLRYAFFDLYDEIVWWLALGLLVAGAAVTFLSPTFLAEVGSGLIAKIVMFLIGIPMYICATASTPLAASLLLAGVSPGTVLVFLLAGPATNLGTLGILRREFGARILTVYLVSLAVLTLGAGIVTDWTAKELAIDLQAQLHAAEHVLPRWLQAISAAVLVLMAIPPLRRPILSLFTSDRGARTG